MKFLIPTEPNDMHSLVVKKALERTGHQVTLIFTADQPTRQKNSMFIDASDCRWQSASTYQTIVENNYDVVWWRRPGLPHIPVTITHPDDHQFVVRENILFYESFTYTISPDAWWVNSKESARRVNFKVLQLSIASDCGMIIPTTLCSNDPSEIRMFLLTNELNGVIYKPLSSDVSLNDKLINLSCTSRVTFLDLPSNQALQRAPGIFQKEVVKKFDLRVICFGNHLIAAKLTYGIYDIKDTTIPLQVEPYILPEDLITKILTFMHEIGIVFGVLNFIVTPDNEYIFIEVCEQGSFLWIEARNPEFNLLDMFIKLLVNKSVDFKIDHHDAEHRLAMYAA